MTSTQLQGPEEPHRPIAPLPTGQDLDWHAFDAGEVIQRFNASNAAHEDLWSRVFHAGDAVHHSSETAHRAVTKAEQTRMSHLAIQAEQPQRRAPRGRQLTFAAATVILDAVASYFAAQALGGGQLVTLTWAALFLAVLAGGEVALDLTRDRGDRRAWRLLALGVAIFVVGLGVLRFSYLATVGADEPIAALVGAVSRA